ncbi:MAG: lamin tail domain-containing protein [Candidatus Doudnabacteria bacterium]|nr:lamin tail domain-containing protein [Candidatus Doudnabacteria bacterium]
MKTYIFIAAAFSLFFCGFAHAAITADHLVISQIQITGGPGKTTSDFVEIYNPTTADIDLDGSRLVKRTKEGTSDASLKSWTETTMVKAGGYYLWANSNFFDISVPADVTTSGSISDDNGIALRKGPADSGEVIDSVAWGEAANVFVEGVAFPSNSEANQSLVRNSDTENNATDFMLGNSLPRNSQTEIITDPTPAPNPEPSPTPTPTPTPETQPAPTPTPPPVPSASPTPSPSSNPVRVPEKPKAKVIPVEVPVLPAILISEILPEPKNIDQEEFIELLNIGATDADLTGYILSDSARTYKLKSVIKSGEYLVIYKSESKLALNNSGPEVVSLATANQQLIDAVAYENAPANQSYNLRSDETYAWSVILTPMEPNQIAASSNKSKANIQIELPEPDLILPTPETQPQSALPAAHASEILGTSTQDSQLNPSEAEPLWPWLAGSFAVNLVFCYSLTKLMTKGLSK